MMSIQYCETAYLINFEYHDQQAILSITEEGDVKAEHFWAHVGGLEGSERYRILWLGQQSSRLSVAMRAMV